MEPLRIHLFGGFLLERGEDAIAPIASRAGRSLFAYLVMHRGRPMQRDLLAGSFWPDLPEGRARRRLSHTLWQIQDVVSEGPFSHLAVTADTLAFDTSVDYWLDVEEFDSLFEASNLAHRGGTTAGRVDAAALRTCVELYRGDFLAGFFDDWVIEDQDHYRQRYLIALSRLVDVTKSSGAYVEALSYARRLTHHDPLSEEGHQEVMRLCFLLGRTSEAVQQFERCRSMLADELGTEPSEATTELYGRIVRQRRAGIRPIPGEERAPTLAGHSDVPFVGREDERRGLVDYLERVLGGPGGVVLVEGEPGVGKTRLAVEAAEDARWRGFEVSWGRCSPGAIRPFAPLVEVLGSLSPLRAEQLVEQVPPVYLREALRLTPAIGGPGSESSSSAPLRPAEESIRMKEALIHTLGALGRIAPHLVVIDDVQWADEDTLSVLTQMGPRLAGSRTLLLLLYRSEEARGDADVWDVLRELDRAAGLGRVVLSPLSIFELGDMVKRTLGVGRIDPSVTAGLHRRTGGNVLFALETLLALRDQGHLDTMDDPSIALEHLLASHTMAVAPRVRSVIDARISLLGDHVAAVYEVAAVCGDPVRISLLAAGSDLPRTRVLDAVDELLHRGLIKDVGDGDYRMTHDQVRQVVYERIEAPRLAELHGRIAEALEEVGPDDVEAIGYHYRAGAIPAKAAAFLLRAGLRAEQLSAYGTARQHLQAAREEAARAGWPAEDRYELLGHLEGVLNVLGRRGDQADVVEEMAVVAGRAHQGDLARRRAWLRAHVGDLTGAEEAARASVAIEGRTEDLSALASSLVALGTCLRWSGRPLEAVEHLESAVMAAADGAPRAEALTELGSTLVEVQMFHRASPHLEEALSIFKALGDLRGQAEVTGILARGLRQQGDSRAAARLYEEAIDLCKSIGYRHGEGVNLVNLSNQRHLTGQVAEALAGYDRAAGIFGELGNLRGEAIVLANAASARHSLLGEDDRAHADAVRASRSFADLGDRGGEAQCLEIMAGIAARLGRRDEALDLLERSLEKLEGTGDRFLEGQHLRSLALLHVDRGEHTEAASTLDRAERVSVEAGLDDLAVELMSVRGLLLASMGRPVEGAHHTKGAVEALTPGVERPYLIHHRHSKVTGAAGDCDGSAAAALEAHRLLDAALSGLPEEQRALATRRVPEYREIIEAAMTLTPQQVKVLLPAVGVPTGRALADSDVLEVTWTVSHPEDIGLLSPIEQRRHRLRRLLEETETSGAVASIEDLAAALGVSDSTVRRDLTALRAGGYRAVTRGQRLNAS